MKTPRPTRPLVAAGFFVCTSTAALALLSLSGCNGEESSTAAATPDAAYTTQGRVAMLRTPESPASEFKIHHETIPNFTDKDGQVIGMNSHVMAFPRVAEDVDVSSLRIGQPVRFTFEVTWGDSSPTWIITELEPLPEDTRFAFEPSAEGDVDQPQGDDAPEGG